MTTRRIEPFVIAVGSIALILRCVRPGLSQVIWDEINLLFWSLRIARYGDWIWVSNNWIAWDVSWNPIRHHSPLNNYLLALPYLFTTDPRHVRLFVAVLGALSVVLVYWVVRRYFGTLAAVITGLLMATSATQVEWVRHISNPNLAPLFIGLAMLAGLMGYYENKRGAIALHWIALAIAIQNHPANALLAFPSIFLIYIGWRLKTVAPRQLIVSTLIGWLLAGLTFVPWIIGIVQTQQGISSGVMLVENKANEVSVELGLTDLFDQFARVTAGVDYQMDRRATEDVQRFGWPPNWTEHILNLQAALMLVSSIILIAWGVFQHDKQKQMALVYLGLIALVPSILGNILSPGAVDDFYILSINFGAYPAFGILLAWLLRRNTLLRVLSLGIVVPIVLLQLSLTAASYRWLDGAGWQQTLRAPMDIFRDYVAEWTADDGRTVFVIDTFDEKYSTVDSQIYFWTVMSEGHPLALVNRLNGSGIPISASTPTTAIGLSSGATIPSLFGQPDYFGLATQDTTPVFQKVRITPDVVTQPNFVVEAESTFANGATILGISATTESRSDSRWLATLLWTTGEHRPDTDYQFSIRLVDEEDRIYGQHDFRSLDAHLWQPDNLVLSPFEIAIRDDLPTNMEARFQILMYSWPDMVNADVIDTQQNVTGQWLYLRES